MSKAKFVGKRTLAIVLTIALMLTTIITFNIGTVIGSAAAGSTEAITVTENAQENVYFYVPEQIYLTPDLDSYQTQDRYNFQWYVDSSINKTTHLATPRTGENTSGNFYFHYKNAQSITVTFKYLNQDFSEMTAYTSTSQSTTAANYVNQNSTIKLASNSVEMSAINTRSDVARTRYTVASNTIDTTVETSGSLSPYLVADSTGYYIEWTVNYVDGNDGITKAVRAYTYVYKPYTQAGGVALRTYNKCGDNHYGSNLSWIAGIHGFNTSGSYYPKSEIGERGLVTFSSSNPQGYKIGDLYAQWANSIAANGRFGYSTNNNGSSDWLSTSANEFSKHASFNYVNNETTSSNTWDTDAYYTLGTSAEARLMVDTSRYTNFNQIPNLSVGMMVTDDESSDSDGAWYIADMTGKSDSSETVAAKHKNGTSNAEAIWNNYTSIFANQGTPSSTVGGAEADGVKYNGRFNKSLSTSNTSGYYNVRTGYYNHDGGDDTIWNVSVLKLNVTINNKQALRDAYERATNAAAYLGLCEDGSTKYYDHTSAAWLNYVSYYIAAGQLLANLDTMSTITVNGTAYTCDQLAAALNSAIANVQNVRRSSVAYARFLAIELNASGDYVLKDVKNIYARSNIIDESLGYEYGDTVTYTAPSAPGYEYVGYIEGMDYSADMVIGSDYSAILDGTAPTISHSYVSTPDYKYTFIYAPAEISSIVDTKDGIYNFMKTLTEEIPSEIAGAGYPTATARPGVTTDFNYKIEGNDVIAWTTDVNTREQYMFLPFYVDTTALTSYRVTYDVAGTDAANVKISLINSNFTGGNGNSTSEYMVAASGGTFKTNAVDTARAYVKLELSGNARNGKTVRISNICFTHSDHNELYMDTTKGYPAVYTAASSAPKTDMNYTTSDVAMLTVTTRYNTLMYEQHQMLPYYVQLKPNCSYDFTYDVTGIDPSNVKLSLYNASFTGGNGDTMNYYTFDASGSAITVGANDDAVAQLRIDVLDASAGTNVTISNLCIENLDTKTTVEGTLNQTTTLSIPVKEGYKLNGWNLKSNSGGSANGTITATGNDRIYEYTFGSGIDIIEAEWVPATLTVVFRAEDGTVISEQNVTYGNAATAPTEIPSKFGHTFAGWDTDFSNVTTHLIIEPTYTEKDIAVTVTAEDAEIYAGSTTNVSATFEPNEPEISAVEWTSSNNAIAKVDSEGVVTGVSAGAAIITGTITYDGRTYSASTTVKVNPVEVTSIAVNTMPEKTTYYTGDEFDSTGLTLTVTYNNGTTAVVSEGFTFNTINTTYAGSKTVRVTYEGKTTTFRITVVELEITSIEVVTLPEVTEYYIGDTDFDTTGLKVVARYNNGKTEELSEGDYELDGFDTSVAGTVEIMVYYEDFETSFDITVKSLDVTGIIVKTPPTKTEYFVGDAANYAGLTLTATYSNGVTATIKDGYTVTGFDSETAGTKTLTVEYEGKTATFTVNVKAVELEKIEIVTPANKTEYFVGEASDFSGLTIKATYNNGTTETIATGFDVTGFDSETAGQKTITVAYGGKTVTFNATVKAIELVSIEIATPATKTEYFAGEAADYAGLTIKANYNNGTSAMVEGYTVTGFDSETAGTKTITVAYEGKTVTFTVNVKAVELVSVEIETMPGKTTYYTNEALDATGLTLKATYNNGTTEIIADGYVLGAVDMTAAGTKTVTVTYEGKTTNFNITVNALYVTGVAIETMPDKTEYMIGEAEDYTGLTLKVTYNDGSSVIVSEGYAVAGFNTAAKGTVTLLVSYEGFYETFDITVLGNADWSKVDALLEEIKNLDASLYTNYDEVYYMYVYPFETETLPLAKTVFVSEKDQAEIDKYYNELMGYYNMLELAEVYVERFEVIGGASIKKQGGVNYIVGLQASLTKAKFQSTYADYENVKLEYEMTTARYMGTGSKIIVKSAKTGEVIAEYIVVIYGDVDGSATINARDAVAISDSLAGIADSLTGAEKLAANVEGTRTTINAKDADVIDAVVAGTMVIDQTTGKGVEA